MRNVRSLNRLVPVLLLAAVYGCASPKGNDGSGTGGGGSGGSGPGGTGGSTDNPFLGIPTSKALHVQGNTLRDAAGTTVRLLGVNRAGSEYMCSPPTTGSAVFDGSTGPNSITAMLTWNINTVRLPLNEHCWLGINGSLVSGDEYRAAVVDYVVRLHQRNLYVVLDLHWSAPGSTVIMGGSGGNQLVTMAFADHALDFWTSVATTFKDDPMVIFDLFNEPILNANDRFGNAPITPDSTAWQCWRNGCNVTRGRVAGMQEMLNAVRATGAQQVVVAGGIEWAHNLDQWLQQRPDDPTGNLMAAFHVYQRPLTDCDTEACWNGALATVAMNVPVLTGEMGQQDCGASDFIGQYMRWADARGISYLGWAWNVQNCNTFPALITNVDGTPTGFGQKLKDHLATMPLLH